jgi:hypothetical protein
MGLLLTGEINAILKIEMLNSQPPYPCATYDFSGNWSAAATDIIEIAERNGIIVFAYNDDYASMLENNFTIYSTQDLPGDVSETLGIGIRFNSLLMGTCGIAIESFTYIPANPTSPWLYFYGSKSGIDGFNSELSLLYNKTSPVYGAVAGPPYETILWAFWAGIIICIVFMTLVDAYFQKKEVFVRVLFGAALSGLVIRNMMLDLVAYLLLFVSGYLVLYPFTSIWYDPNLIVIVAGALIFLNSIAYFVLLKIDHKYAVSNSKIPRNVLRISYIIKSCIALPALLSIAGAIVLTQSAVKYINAYNFFADKKEYAFCEFQYKSNVINVENIFELRIKNDTMNKAIYADYFDILKPMVLYGFSLYYEDEIDMVYANRYAYDYISSVIGKFATEGADMTILIPEGERSDKVNEAIEYAKRFAGSQDLSYVYSTLVYNSGADVLCINSINTSSIRFDFAKDPIILFEHAEPSASSKYLNIFYGTTMYRITPELQAEIVRRFSLENEIITVTNAFDHYNHYWFLVKSGLLAAIFISMLTLLLAVIIIYRIVDLEYKVNAIELCIKKTLGHGIWRRNADILVTIYGFDFLCAMAAVLVFWSIGSSPLAVVAAVVILLCIDTIVMFKSIVRIEQARVSEILKGGAL